jgi:hypothetical protein
MYKTGILMAVSRALSRYELDLVGVHENRKREYLKDKINELATNSKNKNIKALYRGINEFKRGYQPRRMRMMNCLQIPRIL